MSCVPQMKRTLAMPKPCVSSASFAAAIERGMIGQAKIIVRTHVQHAFATGDRDVCILGTGDDALGFKQALRFNFFERLRKLFCEISDHM